MAKTWDCSERPSLNKHSGQGGSWLWWDGNAATIRSALDLLKGKNPCSDRPPKLVPFLAYILIPTKSKYNLLVGNLEAVKMSHLSLKHFNSWEMKKQNQFFFIYSHSFVPSATPSFSIASFRKSSSHVIHCISRNLVYMLDSSKSASSQSPWQRVSLSKVYKLPERHLT